MKLIVAIINLDDVAGVMKHLSKGGFSSTKLASTGGLLTEGNVTIIVGVENEKLDEALQTIDKYSHSRIRMIQTPSLEGMDSPPTEVQVGGATVFVLDCEQFLKF